MKILFHEHLFDENPKEYEVEGSTWGEIVEKLGIKGHLAIYDNGETLLYPECHDVKPIMDTVRIMRKPEDKAVNYIVGGVLTVAGAILTFVPGIGASIGVPLFLGGLGMLVGTMLIPPIPKTEGMEDYAGGYNINGTANPNAIGKVPPLVLGEYMVKPPVVGTQVSRIEGYGVGAKTYVKFLYCLGYRGEGVSVSNIKIGDTVFATNEGGVFNGEITVDGGLYGKVELRQDGTLPLLYNTVIKELQVGSEIKKYDDMQKLFYTTVAGCDSVNLSVIFQGLYRINSEGELRSVSEGIRVYMRPAGGTDWTQVKTETYSGSRNQQFTFQITATPTAQMLVDNPAKQWDVMVCKAGSANDTDTKVNAKPYLGFIQFCTTRKPLSEELTQKLVFLACEFEASQELQSRIAEVSCVVKRKYKIWNGTNWDDIDYSSNPAAIYLDLLRGDYLPHKARDEQIDWATIQNLYEWCEENGRTCNWVVSNKLQVRELLNNVLFTCQASFYLKNGLYSVSLDKVQDSPVALLIPKNTSDFQGSKVFNNKVDAIECKFVDKNADYKETTEIVMPYGATEYSNLQSIDMFGTDNYEQAVKIARYLLACNEQRPETYTLRIGIEHYSIPRGSRVLVQHDVLKVGICSGRIVKIEENEYGFSNITIDEVVSAGVEGKTYCITIFKQNGDIVTVGVANPDYGTNVLITDNDLSGVSEGDLYAYGELGMEALDCIVSGKVLGDNMTCELTLVGYSPSVFSAANKEVPVYNPKVYRGNSFYTGGTIEDLGELKDNLVISHFGNIFFDFGTYAQKG